MVASIDLEASQPFLEADEYDAYSGVLLGDHPLRSYPADCPPGPISYTRKYYIAARKRWRERLAPLLCLLLMFFVVVQFLSQLPHLMSYFLQSVSSQELPGFIQRPTAYEPTLHAVTCVYDHLSSPKEVVEQALASGCTGIKVDLWLRNHDFLVGDSPSSLVEGHTLQNIYLQPLLEKLDSRNSAIRTATKAHNDSDGHVPPIGLFDEDPLRSLTLFLEIRTPVRTAWPRLVSQLTELNRRGYLSYRNPDQVVISRPVTVVVTRREGPTRRLSLLDDLMRAIKKLF